MSVRLAIPLAVVAWGILPSTHAAEPDRGERRAEIRERASSRSRSVVEEAVRRGVPLTVQTSNGETAWLQGFDNGQPVYTAVLARSSAISINFHRLYDSYPEVAFGNDLLIGIWDGGSARPDHPELVGRVFNQEDTPHTISDHATAVAGTIGSVGVDPAARGMLPAVPIHVYDIKDDLEEMTERAALLPLSEGPANILVSNHSYGDMAGWAIARVEVEPDVYWQGWFWFGVWPEREDRSFGMYNERARDWDALCHVAPYFLPVRAGGNDRTEGFLSNGTNFRYWDVTSESWVLKSFNASTDPYPDNWKGGGFDTIATFATAKNILTVGAVTYAIGSGEYLPESSRMTGFSSWGPTDDGRIKPDLVALGEDVMSLWGTLPFEYASANGTSFSAPAVSGAALFLQQMNVHATGVPLVSSAVKALLIHTATDIGTAGPDYLYGWGLVDALTAADHLDDHLQDSGAQLLFVEDLVEGETWQTRFEWDGFSPIRATICWTDPPGPIRSELNDPSPVLVNDLDLRLKRAGTDVIEFPFVLDVANPATAASTGDNLVDNVEQIHVSEPEPGEYILQVSHKGALEGERQTFALVLSGHHRAGLNVQSLESEAQRIAIGDEAAQFAWRLTNASDETLEWSVASAPDWLSFAVNGGSIAPGEEFTLFAEAADVNLAPGLIHDEVLFSDDTFGTTRRRRVELDVWKLSVPGFSDDFEQADLKKVWRVTGVGQFQALVREDLGPIDTAHLVLDDYMTGGARSRIELTTLVDRKRWNNLQLSFDTKAFHTAVANPHANPYIGGVSTTGVSLSADGVVWTEVLPLRGTSIGSVYATKSIDLDAAIAASGLDDADRIFVRFNTFVRNRADAPTNMSGLALDNIALTGVATLEDLWSIH